MDYIILDMEWNMRYSDFHILSDSTKLRGEIIEIGAAKLDWSLTLVDTFKILVRPAVYRSVIKRITKLTGITNDDLLNGFDFVTALEHFRQWCGDNYCFITWGSCDEAILRQNLTLHGCAADWIPMVYDIQPLYAHHIGQPGAMPSLLSALEYFGEPPLDAHDALHDAMNTFAVCRHLDLDEALMEYDNILNAPILIENPSPGVLSTLRMRCESHRAAMKCAQVASFVCPVCGKPVACGGWRMRKPGLMVTIAECPGCRTYHVRLRLRNCSDGYVHVSRSVAYLTDMKAREYGALPAAPNATGQAD